MAFMHNVNCRNVNEALSKGLRILTGFTAMQEPSRVGNVRVMPGPVTTIYDNPTERVLFSPLRDANPFFHLFESLWMLAGREDLGIPVQFNKRFNTYSDDGGKTQPAAYGYRWRRYFGYDQIEAVVHALKTDPTTRRVVLSMWDGGGSRDNSVLLGTGDMARAIEGSADIPCNTQCFFRVNGGRLDMGITCRSNDMLWGAYGANAVHFSVLMEYVAAKVGVSVGTMYQFSWNYHYYEDIVGDAQRAFAMADDAITSDYYVTKRLRPLPMFADVASFDYDLPHFMDILDPAVDDVALHEKGGSLSHDGWLRNTAIPMWWAWQAHKRKEYPEADVHCSKIAADDWRAAAKEWIERRAQRHRDRTDVAG